MTRGLRAPSIVITPSPGIHVHPPECDERAAFARCRYPRRIRLRVVNGHHAMVCTSLRTAVHRMHHHRAPARPRCDRYVRPRCRISLVPRLRRLLLGFLNTLPTETTLRVWDVFFVVGSRALFAAALATLRLLHPQLACAEGFEDACASLRHDLNQQ